MTVEPNVEKQLPDRTLDGPETVIEDKAVDFTVEPDEPPC